MAYMTRAWLMGGTHKGQPHYPIAASVVAEHSDWKPHPEVFAEIKISCERLHYTPPKAGDYQILYLDKNDANEILPLLARGADIDVQKQIALEAFQKLEATEALQFLTEMLNARAKQKGKGE